jgi:hypothetical protein
MSSREAFEAWAKGAKLYGRDMAPGAWDAWQAAERQALEMAIDFLPLMMEHESYKLAVKTIRALIDAQSREEQKDGR